MSALATTGNAILSLLAIRRACAPAEIAEAMGVNPYRIHQAIHRLFMRNKVARHGKRGFYTYTLPGVAYEKPQRRASDAALWFTNPDTCCEWRRPVTEADELRVA